MNAPYAPALGDIVWLDFDPRVGHDRSGRRPTLVLSPDSYNRRRGMMICCPMTSQIKNYAFEVIVTTDPPRVVLADQLKSVDWRAREAVRESVVARDVLAEVRAKIKALLQI